MTLTASVAISRAQGPNPDYSWLNGTWEGTPPLGGQMRMELQVVSGNQVKGSGFIVQTKGRTNTRPIEGTVDGDKVELSYFGVNDVTIKYVLTFVDGALKGTGTHPNQPAPVETIFKKLK
jgi:hypothetical protein